MNTEELLAQRATTHGDYSEHARCTQAIMRAMMVERNWDNLPDIMKESLHMFAHKMGRVVTGNPDIHDHWDDIAGYAKLVSQRIPDTVPETFKSVRADTETKAMTQHVEKNILGGKSKQATEVAQPFGYEEQREFLVRRPLYLTIEQAQDEVWFGDKVGFGTASDETWFDLYRRDEVSMTYVMIPAYQMEYGKPA